MNPAAYLERPESELPSYTHQQESPGPFTITKELFLAAETIFTPSLTTDINERKPLIDEIYETVLASDLNPKDALSYLSNVVLVGGNTWFPGKHSQICLMFNTVLGFKERVEQDMRAKLAGNGFCKVHAFPKQAVSYWRTVSFNPDI